jgi:hypothetical protein
MFDGDEPSRRRARGHQERFGVRRIITVASACVCAAQLRRRFSAVAVTNQTGRAAFLRPTTIHVKPLMH